ncbi:helix-turn-helix transcriptional regulator [Dyadobacter sp. CY345]|uniref:helix-turn-helix transcriptional regulator n=1 Tax=Dyadobacter sp. CY345 TaxID=2909335 RepID=UPI001F18D725|nr:helix-turn-helix transcriptional regulator [Dyadobacter sp. CY345]MCF2442568.1 helix-turn-helix transcriptional regulator [Dyadobacter sp. CY345]
MVYQQIAPPVYLQDKVRYFCSLENTFSDQSTTTFKPIADGCPGIMFHQSECGNLAQYDKKLPEIFLYGQTTKPIEIAAKGIFKTFGIVFQPAALKLIFGLDADELTNSCADFDGLLGNKHTRILKMLVNSNTFSEQRNIISAFLFSIENKIKVDSDKSIQYAVSSILASKGHVRLKDLLSHLQLSERTFERKFKQWVGISPKLFARICQFQASLDSLRTNNYEKLSDIAFENQYADQSHFIRAFKEFSGFSPCQYQKEASWATENFLAFPK